MHYEMFDVSRLNAASSTRLMAGESVTFLILLTFVPLQNSGVREIRRNWGLSTQRDRIELIHSASPRSHVLIGFHSDDSIRI
jgi:hypothetical protein